MSNHPTVAGGLPTARAQIVAALRQRAGGDAAPEVAEPANLPALITAQPSDPGSGPGAGRTRAPQESGAAASFPTACCPQCAAALPGAEPVPTSAEGRLFDRARQVLFLENLSLTGSVRSAASAAQVSHQSAYRARRATPAFRTAWDAALVVARAAAADTLACRAIDGVEEKVFYHGEEVATRTRYSDRLLLAHLARLDKLADAPAPGNSDVHIRFAEDFDAALARFGRGEEAVPQPACGPDFSSPGPCNTRSRSNSEFDAEEANEDYDADDEHDDEYDFEDAEDQGEPAEPEPPKLEQWKDPVWLAAEVAKLNAAMEAARPADAPQLTGIGPDGVDRDPDFAIDDAQAHAFQNGVKDWYLVVPPIPREGKRYHYLHETEEEYGDGEPDEDQDEDDNYDLDADDNEEDDD
ncbi:hypothetical protein [Qipengyuania sediminis]|uniref:hypothetical protein n=1 Tax=Qipengyuania sediminis TaxID=1532023 RepID=UPI001980A98B|nr:hypothetical protein [Qipengyuania sediminis]